LLSSSVGLGSPGRSSALGGDAGQVADSGDEARQGRPPVGARRRRHGERWGGALGEPGGSPVEERARGRPPQRVLPGLPLRRAARPHPPPGEGSRARRTACAQLVTRASRNCANSVEPRHREAVPRAASRCAALPRTASRCAAVSRAASLYAALPLRGRRRPVHRLCQPIRVGPRPAVSSHGVIRDDPE